MKTVFIIFAVLLLGVPKIYSQEAASSAYYDAFYFRQFLLTNNNSLFFTNKTIAVLKKYFSTDDIDILTSRIRKNPFLKDVLIIPDTQDGLKKDISSPASFFSSLGSLDVTNLADGVAKFLVKRSKQELTVAFFDRFNTFISSDKYKDARILFPQTYATLQAIGTEIYNYQAYINSLREAFEKDLNGLLLNLPNVIKDGRYSAFFSSHPDLKAGCLSALYIGNSLINKEHPGEIIAGYDADDLLKDIKNKNVLAAVKTLQLFSASFQSAGTDHFWISKDSLQLLLSDDITYKIYLGLMYEKFAGIVLDGGITLQSIFAKSASVIHNFDKYLKGFIQQAGTVTGSIKNMAGKETDKLTFTDYYNFYNSALDIIQYASETYQLPGLDTLKPSENFAKYISIARAGGNIAFDINRKNYSSAVINAYTLYNSAFGGDIGTLDDIMKNSAPGVAAFEEAKQLKVDKTAINIADNVDELKVKLLKYASFMAAITQAQSSDDVAGVIEAVALPSGSSRIKRETPFNVSLNAYTGLYAGYEKINGIDNATWKWNSYGVTAPIGISLSAGQRKWFGLQGGGHWSYSLFLSIIDIGAVTAFRFNNDSTKINDTTMVSASQSPSIQLKNIISPGLFLSIGIPKSPLSINFGAQMGPNLRKISVAEGSTAANIDYSNNVYWRYSISLVVDIPVLNFYTKSK